MMTTAHDIAAFVTRLRGRHLQVVAIGAAGVLAGCYNYLPVQPGTAAPGAEVRVLLTDAGSVGMASLIGPRVTTLDGLMDRVGDDSLVLRVQRVTNMRGEETVWTGERVPIPTSGVASVQQKRLSATRTGLAAAAGIGIFTAAVLAAGTGGGAEPPVIVGPLPGGQ